MKVKDAVKMVEKKELLPLSTDYRMGKSTQHGIFLYNQAIDDIGNLDLDEGKLREIPFIKEMREALEELQGIEEENHGLRLRIEKLYHHEAENFTLKKQLVNSIKKEDVSVGEIDEIVQTALEKSVTEDKTVYNEEQLFELLGRMKLVENIVHTIHDYIQKIGESKMSNPNQDKKVREVLIRIMNTIEIWIRSAMSKDSVLTENEIEYTKEKISNQALTQLNAIYEEGLPSVQKMSEITAELVEQNFPKGKCKERGQALVLHAQMLIAIHDLIRGKK